MDHERRRHHCLLCGRGGGRLVRVRRFRPEGGGGRRGPGAGGGAVQPVGQGGPQATYTTTAKFERSRKAAELLNRADS